MFFVMNRKRNVLCEEMSCVTPRGDALSDLRGDVLCYSVSFSEIIRRKHHSSAEDVHATGYESNRIGHG